MKQFSILTVTFLHINIHAYQRNIHCEKLKYLNLTALFPTGLSEIKYFLDFVTNQ